MLAAGPRRERGDHDVAGRFGAYLLRWAKNAAWQRSHSGGSRPSSQQSYLDTAKAGTWEGGHRTAGIVWAPGLVAPDSSIMEVVLSVDIFVTTLSLAGIPLPVGRAYDGQDLTPLLRGEPGARSPHQWFFYYTTCTESHGCPPANLTSSLPSDRIAAVRDARGPMKAHFFTHSGQQTEPYVSHTPPLVFNVERDPGEKEPVTAGSWDGPDCTKSGAACLAEFIKAATAAVEAQQRELVWCEHCAADGVHGRSMLSATVDRSVMDCRGLPAAQAGCCSGGHCECRHSGGL